MPETQDERQTVRLRHQRMINMLPFILVSTRGGMDVLTFRDVVKAVSYCARMDRFGIAYEMVTY